MEVSAGQGGIVALLLTAITGGGTMYATKTETASQDRCIEIVQARVAAAESQRQADLEAQRISYNALQSMCVEMCGR